MENGNRFSFFFLVYFPSLSNKVFFFTSRCCLSLSEYQTTGLNISDFCKMELEKEKLQNLKLLSALLK